MSRLSEDAGVEGVRIYVREQERDYIYSMNGGLFFLGVFLGLLFIMATVLIMYYKQLSEGYDDKRNFSIMRKVGLEKAEIRRSVRSQVLIMFYLPLVTACVHIAFAFPLHHAASAAGGHQRRGAVRALHAGKRGGVRAHLRRLLWPHRPHLLPHRRF